MLEPLEEPHVFISVTTPGDPALAVLPTNEKTLGVLRLCFHECYDEWQTARENYAEWYAEREQAGEMFTRKTGKQVLDFARQHPEAEVFVAHCDGGLARSPGILLALSRTVLIGRNIDGLPEDRPWPSCYRHIVEAWLFGVARSP